MKKARKSTFFIALVIILGFAYTTMAGIHYYFGDRDDVYVKGLKDIRLGIDIQGGVDATFSPADGYDATNAQMDAVLETIKMRLAAQNILDSETYVDHDNDNVIVRFPWQAGEKNFDPEEAILELGQTAMLMFVEGGEQESYQTLANFYATGDTDGIVLTGNEVEKASSGVSQSQTGEIQHVVNLKFNDEGRQAFATATTKLYSTGGQISIWMDDQCISAPTVQAPLTEGTGVITGNFTAEAAKKLADQINSGALPFKLTTPNTKTISPTLGHGALDAMLLAALIAFGFIAVFMLWIYRMQGVIAVVGLIAQITGIIALVSGWFGFMPSSTLTIPGIAGIILSIGMCVDANVITGERIKEELNAGKSIDSALKSGYKRAFSAIFDGNLTGIIVAIVLMGAFGVPDSPFAKVLSPIFRWFGVSTEGTVYSFGFTLLTGTILNMFAGTWLSRIMSMSLARFPKLRKKQFYGTGIVYKN